MGKTSSSSLTNSLWQKSIAKCQVIVLEGQNVRDSWHHSLNTLPYIFSRHYGCMADVQELFWSNLILFYSILANYAFIHTHTGRPCNLGAHSNGRRAAVTSNSPYTPCLRGTADNVVASLSRVHCSKPPKGRKHSLFRVPGVAQTEMPVYVSWLVNTCAII